MQPTTDRTDPDCAHRHGDAGVRMDRVCDTVPPRLLRALISMGRALRHPWALAIEPSDMSRPITIAEWVDAEEAVAHAIAIKEANVVEPFPLSYHNGMIHWSCEPGGIELTITRPYREVVALEEHLQAAENALVKLNGVGVDGLSAMSADWPTLAPLLNAHKAALLALRAPTVQMGQIVCGLLLRPDGSCEWHPATHAPPQRAEGRHWYALMSLAGNAGYAPALADPLKHRDVMGALDAMSTYNALADETRACGYRVPRLATDELISWVAWGISARCSTGALCEFVGDAVVELGGDRPPGAVLRLWGLTWKGGDLRDIAAELRAQQLRGSGKPVAPAMGKTMRATGEPPESRGGVRGDADADSLFGGQE